MPVSPTPYASGTPGRFTPGLISSLNTYNSEEAQTAQYLNQVGLTTPVYHAILEHQRQLAVQPDTDFLFVEAHYTDPEVFQILLGCMKLRGPIRARNRFLNDFGQWDEKFANLEVLEFLHAEHSRRIKELIPARIEDATNADQIMLATGMTWPAYAILHDACLPFQSRDAENLRLGTLRNTYLDEIRSLGFGYSAYVSEIMTAQERREYYGPGRGRPAKILIPTSWGRHLVHLLKDQGIKVPPDARKAARRAVAITDRTKIGRRGFTPTELVDLHQKTGQFAVPTPEEANKEFISGGGHTYAVPEPTKPVDEPVSEKDLDLEMFTIDHRNLPDNWDQE